MGNTGGLRIRSRLGEVKYYFAYILLIPWS
jgi:hypothetical protein